MKWRLLEGAGQVTTSSELPIPGISELGNDGLRNRGDPHCGQRNRGPGSFSLLGET